VATAVWTGTISFGLVSIPVKLYPATQSKDVRFHLVDPTSGRRIRYKRVVEGEPTASVAADDDLESEPSIGRIQEESPSAGRGPGVSVNSQERELRFDELARGYESDPGRFVTIPREDIDRLRPPRSRTIEVEEFVELESIDPVFFEKTYYAAPQPVAEQPYLLLLRAMERAGLVGIARFVLRTKPHLVAIRPMDSVLGLETMYFADEVRSPSELVWGLDASRVGGKELDLAGQLIEAMRTDWNPSQYSDEYREELLRLISERDAQLPTEETSPTVAEPKVQQLMDALKASVEAAKRERLEQKKATRKRRPAS
jgi:DNA end-binding protein Ku